MNTLQTGLLVLGLGALLAVWAFNMWQQHQAQMRTSAREKGERKEPVDQLGEQDVDSFLPTEDSGLAPLMPEVHIREQEPIDALIDSVMVLDLSKPCLGAVLLKTWPNTRRIGSKPLLLEAWNEAAAYWEFPQHRTTYRQVQLAVQLDNRQGPLNAIEFSEFVALAQRFADHDAIQAHMPPPQDMGAEIKRALELEAFAKEVDVQLEFYVATNGAPWSVALVEECARPFGFWRDKEVWRMFWHQPDAPGAEPSTALTLQFDAQAALSQELHTNGVYRLQLLLDVPRMPQSLQPFQTLRAAMTGLAERLDGKVVDRSGLLISSDLLDELELQLADIYLKLEARDLAAGSPQAKRLFS